MATNELFCGGLVRVHAGIAAATQGEGVCLYGGGGIEPCVDPPRRGGRLSYTGWLQKSASALLGIPGPHGRSRRHPHVLTDLTRSRVSWGVTDHFHLWGALAVRADEY